MKTKDITKIVPKMKQLKEFVPKMKQYTINTIKIVVFILGIVFILEYFSGKGLIGFLIIFLLFGLWRLWVMREFFMSNLRNIETTMFSKPLDREMWGENEFKNTKIKVRWKNDATKHKKKSSR